MTERYRIVARRVAAAAFMLLLLWAFAVDGFMPKTILACHRKHLSDNQPTFLSAVQFDRGNNSTHLLSRRSSITSCITTASACFVPLLPSSAVEDEFVTTELLSSSTRASITVPLQYEPKLSAYTVSYVVGDTKFGAIVDTGSPFLVVPQTSCRPDYKWGCYRAEESQPSGLEPTYERFVGNEGMMEWREGKFSFPDTSSSVLNLLFPQSSSMIFGVVSETLLDGTGGLFLGLVKETNSGIRPSFLGQSDVGAFSVDLRKREDFQKSLTLYKSASEKQSTPSFAIQLVRDLNKRFGDATIHYVGVASSLIVNGFNLATSSRRKKIYVIFDTGCSGMSISESLFNERYSIARERRENNLWGNVEVQFKTVSGGMTNLTAKKPLTTTLDDRPWGKKLDGYLVVLGLAFLERHEMTVDIDNEKIWFD